MCSYAHMLGKSTPKMAAIFVIVRKANCIRCDRNATSNLGLSGTQRCVY